MVISHNPCQTIEAIGKFCELKDGTLDEHKSYLGAEVEDIMLPNGQQTWSMHSNEYCKVAIDTVWRLLADNGHDPKSGKHSHKGPLPSGYRPELNITKEPMLIKLSGTSN